MIPIYEMDTVKDFLEKLKHRSRESAADIRKAVSEILKTIKKEGDAALVRYTQKWDGCDLERTGLRVSADEIADGASSIPDEIVAILRRSTGNIRRFHEKQKRTSWIDRQEDGVLLGQRFLPLERVGVYVPGGRAVYPSSLLMAAVPAQVAGVKEIVVASPPDEEGNVHPSILAAASVLGIGELYRVGGAQAVAALAFGTQTIRRVDKIAGPGNMFVAEAKRQVFGTVGIDMIAGPSEVAVLADASADPGFIASDLLAQAEHDPAASSILITDSRRLAEEVQKAVLVQAEHLKRKDIFIRALQEWGAILITGNIRQGIDLVNTIAPEHLGLHLTDPWKVLDRIRNAGAIFMGAWSPETVGDYWAGPNHVLPTNQTARFSSPLSTDDFMKSSSLIQYTREALLKDGTAIRTFAEMEGLDGHANAVKQRTS
jgi:histidinol dehydrogenase